MAAGTDTAASKWSDLGTIVASVAAFVGLLSSLAVAGLLGRSERDHGDLLFTASVCVVVAASFWVCAAVVPSKTSFKIKGKRVQVRLLLRLLGVGALIGGLSFGLSAVIRTQHDLERPDITASLVGDHLTVDVTAHGLNSGDRVEVHIDGLQVRPAPQPDVAGVTNLYWASIGANGDGEVNLPVTLTLPDGLYNGVGIRAFSGATSDCFSFSINDPKHPVRLRDGPGCVILQLAPVQRVPELSTAWKGGSLSVDATAANAGGEILIVDVLAIRAGHKPRLVAYLRQLADPSSGTVRLATAVVPPRSTARICVFAFLESGDDKAIRPVCGARSVRAATAELAVPAAT